MAGVGRDCGRHRPGRRSCLADGLIDVLSRRSAVKKRHRKPCSFVKRVTTGVLCCKRPEKWQLGQSFTSRYTIHYSDRMFTVGCWYDTIWCDKAKTKARDSYIACLTGTKPDQPRFTVVEVAVDRQESVVLQRYMRPSIARTNEQLDPRQQLANTPPQSTTPGLHPVSIHQMASPEWTSNCSLLLIYRPPKGWKAELA